MAGIFISYRRADSDGWAGRLRDALRVRFGNRVFQDVESIADGEIFSEVIDRALQECDVALIIIGPNWASAHNAGGRRLDQNDDWVRTETALVLERKIRVIPVLVGGAQMPNPEDLPEELRSLTRRQAREIRSNSWDSDVALLASHLKQIVDTGHTRRAPLYALAAFLVVAAALGGYAASRYFGQPTEAPTAAERAAPAAGTRVEREEPAPARPVVAAQPMSAPPEKPALGSPQPPAAKPAPEPPVAAAPPATRPPVVAAPAPPRPPAAALRAPEPAQPGIARTEPPPARPAAKSVTETPAPKPAAAPGETEAPRVATAPATPAAGARQPAPPVADAASLNLPNRPAAARELKVGDSWTYRLREVRFDRNLATVTHEIGGGDRTGIRETLKTGRGAGDTQRRLPLEPRIFEQQLDQNATLFEFAPFMAAFSELQPGASWKGIAGATSPDSINDWRFSGKVTGRERVRVPAGSFEAIRAELEGQVDLSFPSTRDPFSETTPSYQTYTVWFVPEIGRAIKYERRSFNRGRRLLEHDQYELMSYRLK